MPERSNPSNDMPTGKTHAEIPASHQSTRPRAADEDLRESERRYRTVVNSTPQGFWLIDCERRTQEVNQALCDMLGYTSQEMLGRSPVEFADEANQAIFKSQMARIGSTERRRYEITLRKKDGSEIHTYFNATTLGDASGRTIGSFAFVTDLTEHKRVQEALRESEEGLAEAMQIARLGSWQLDLATQALAISPQHLNMMGYRPARAELVLPLSEYIRTYIHPDDHPTMALRYQYAIENSDDPQYRDTFEYRLLHPDGTVRTVAVTARPMRGRPGVIHGVTQDITERKRAEAEIKESRARLHAIIEHEPECVKLLDRTGRVLEMNPAGLAMLDAERPEDVIGQPGQRWVLPEYQASCQSLFDRVFDGQSGMLEIEAEGLKGRRVWLETHAVPLRDADGTIIAVLAVTRDITERKRVQAKLQHDALHDALTGLPNRALFMDRLGHCIERAKRRSVYMFAVVFLDLDRFKIVNDSLGHLVGDELLVDTARRLERCIRQVDTVARLGGDEFGLLIDDIADLSDATHTVERVQSALAAPFRHAGQEIFPTASIGIALSSLGYEQPQDIMRDADTAMYRAKAGGRARFQVFDAAMHERALRTLRLETDLRYAIERDQLRLYYQPIVDATTRSLAGFEALLRWQHPERGLVGPAEFIPMAEDTGLIIPLGAWVLQTACRQLHHWQARFPDRPVLPVAVNLSSKQFLHPGLGADIRAFLHEAGLDGRHLKLEITESILMENPELAAKVLLEVKQVGIAVCMDDFGTGYSSLSSLHELPIDVLKIDKSFVGRMEAGLKNAEFVRTIISLAHNLGMTVVAEGVETDEQLKRLQELDCECVQGYLISSPLPADGVPAFIEKQLGQHRIMTTEAASIRPAAEQ